MRDREGEWGGGGGGWATLSIRAGEKGERDGNEVYNLVLTWYLEFRSLTQFLSHSLSRSLSSLLTPSIIIFLTQKLVSL